MATANRPKPSKETGDLNRSTNQQDLQDVSTRSAPRDGRIRIPFKAVEGSSGHKTNRHLGPSQKEVREGYGGGVQAYAGGDEDPAQKGAGESEEGSGDWLNTGGKRGLPVLGGGYWGQTLVPTWPLQCGG